MSFSAGLLYQLDVCFFLCLRRPVDNSAAGGIIHPIAGLPQCGALRQLVACPLAAESAREQRLLGSHAGASALSATELRSITHVLLVFF